MEQFIAILLYVIPGFLFLETARYCCSRVGFSKSKEDKLYKIMIASLAVNAIAWAFGVIKTFPPTISSMNIWLFVLAISLGFLWGIYSPEVAKKWFNREMGKDAHIFSGDETVLETVLRRNDEACLVEKKDDAALKNGKQQPVYFPKAIVDLHLKDGTIIVGDITFRPHDSSDKGVFIQPWGSYYESLHTHEQVLGHNEDSSWLKKSKKRREVFLQELRTECCERAGERYIGIYVDPSEIKMVKFLRPA
jgi:hypothetical protein